MNLTDLIDKLSELMPDARAVIDHSTGEIQIRTGLKKGSSGGELVDVNSLSTESNSVVHYFAADGNYGDANGIMLVNTEHWLPRDWVQIEDSTDSTRLRTAIAISTKNSRDN